MIIVKYCKIHTGYIEISPIRQKNKHFRGS